MKKDTSWGGVSDWYDELVRDGNSYQSQVLLPNIIRVVGGVDNASVLDLACGQGFFSKALVEKGALVTGIDIAEELIEKARQQVPEADFFVSPAHAIPVIKSESKDVVVIVLALQNIKEYQETLLECARVLKTGGRLILVLNHPTFRIPKRSGWGWDESSSTQYRRIDGYMSESSHEIDMHPGAKKRVTTLSFHRPLQVYVKALAKAGFVITGLEEWISHRKSEKGPRRKAEDKARKEIPLFMMIAAQR